MPPQFPFYNSAKSASHLGHDRELGAFLVVSQECDGVHSSFITYVDQHIPTLEFSQIDTLLLEILLAHCAALHICECKLLR